jgi:membrane protease YdiL (CAAX protease family)
MTSKLLFKNVYLLLSVLVLSICLSLSSYILQQFSANYIVHLIVLIMVNFIFIMVLNRRLKFGLKSLLHDWYMVRENHLITSAVFVLLAISLALLNHYYVSDFIRWMFNRSSIKPDACLLTVNMMFASVLIGPVIEEIIFRRIIYSELVKYESVLFAILYSSVLFSIYHLSGINPVRLSLTFIGGIFLSFVYHKQGSLLLNVVCHASYNSVIIFLPPN